jgi:hypothetical protein
MVQKTNISSKIKAFRAENVHLDYKLGALTLEIVGFLPVLTFYKFESTHTLKL